MRAIQLCAQSIYRNRCSCNEHSDPKACQVPLTFTSLRLGTWNTCNCKWTARRSRPRRRRKFIRGSGARSARSVDGKGRGGEERTQSEAITFGFGLNLLTIYSSWENRIMRGERGGGCYKKRLGLHPCGFLSHVRARCCPPPPCSCCGKGTCVEEKGWPDFFVVDDSHGPANLAYCIQPICCLLRPWPAIFRLVNLYFKSK